MTPELSAAYDALRSTPFPAGSDLDEIDDMHAKLAYVDAMVADALAATDVHGASIPRQALSELHEIIEWSEASTPVPQEVGQVRPAYREYAGLLLALVRLSRLQPEE